MPTSHAKVPTTIAIAIAALLAGCAESAEPADAAAPAPDGSPRAPAPDDEAPAPPADAGAVPHVHDYWDGRERVRVLDAEVTVEPMDAAFWGLMSTYFLDEPIFGGAFLGLPEGALVYEGTGTLEVTVSWTDPTVTGVRFMHRHAGSGEIQPWTETPNGEPVALAVTPEMTDMPHAAASRWAFMFAASGTPAVALGTFHVRMDVVKARDVSVWPGHPDLWGARAELPIADAAGSTVHTAEAVDFLAGEPWAEPADAVRAQALVPMETARLRVTVQVLGVEPDHEVEGLALLVRTAEQAQFEFEDAGAPADVSGDGRTWTWEVPVDMEQTDSPYAKESAWAFRVEPAYASPAPFDCEVECHGAELRYHLAALAVKAPEDAPTDPAAGA